MSNKEKNLNRLVVLYAMPVLILLSIMCLVVGEPMIDFRTIYEDPIIEKGVGFIIITGSTLLWLALALLVHLAI